MTTKGDIIFIIQIHELTFRKGKFSDQDHTEREKQRHDVDLGLFLLFFHSVFSIALAKLML